MQELKSELARAEQKRLEDAAEREASQERAELERYRALEAEQQKWEDKERRLLDYLAGVGEGPQTGRRRGVDSATAGRLEAAEKQVVALARHLEGSETLAQQFSEERDMLRRENRELQGLRAGLALVGATQRGDRDIGQTGVTTTTWLGPGGMPCLATGYPERSVGHSQGECGGRVGSTSSAVTTTTGGGVEGAATGRQPPATAMAWGHRESCFSLPNLTGGAREAMHPLERAPVVGPGMVPVTGGAREEMRPVERAPVVGPGMGPMASGNVPAVSEGLATPTISRTDPNAVATTAVATVAVPLWNTPSLTMPLLGQLPQIPKFSGDALDSGDTFVEWLEQFENIAKLAGWDDHWRLVHLTSNLRGTAASSYRSCSVDVRSEYRSLVDALKRRFTPVRLTAVQTQLFHNRQQAEGETVEQFAQDLQKLFNQAYARAAREGPEAEKLAQTLLTNQFVAGLRQDLKRKLIGVEGGLEELILKARFEEAKGRELAPEASRSPAVTKSYTPRSKPPSQTQSFPLPSSQVPQSSRPRSDTPTNGNPPSSTRARGKCFNCGLEGHMARDCPYPRRNKRDEEARGRREPAVSALTSEEDEDQRKIGELRRQLQELEARVALRAKTDTLHTVAADSQENLLGPTVFVDVLVDGVLAKTLIDTGSPATVISLDFVLDVFAQQRDKGQSPEHWMQNTMKRFSAPEVLLKNYGGDPLDIIAQTQLVLSHGCHSTDATVLVQKGAPHDLLLGTDVQHKLGFALVVKMTDKMMDLLTGEECRVSHSTPGQATLPCETSSDGRTSPSVGELAHPPAPGDPSSAGGPTSRSTDGDGCPDHQPMDRESSHSAEGPGALDLSAGRRSNPNIQLGVEGVTQEDGPSPFCEYPAGNADSEPGQQPQDGPTGVVRLLRTVKIPCGHQKVVQTGISGGLESSLLLFSPSVEQPSLLLPDAAIVGADGSCANLVIENHGIETIHLKRGTLLGTVVPVEQVELEDCPEVGEVCGLGSGSTCTLRAAEPVGDVLAMRADADRAVIGGDGRKGVYPVDTAPTKWAGRLRSKRGLPRTATQQQGEM